LLHGSVGPTLKAPIIYLMSEVGQIGPPAFQDQGNLKARAFFDLAESEGIPLRGKL
jgi:hypothetical protein